MVFCNNAAIASDGTVWFSDSSTSYGIERWRSDIVMATRIRSGPMWLRRTADRIPTRLQPQPIPSLRVQAYDDTGRLVHDLELPHDDYSFVTGVREHDGRVWLGSLNHPAIAVVDL